MSLNKLLVATAAVQLAILGTLIIAPAESRTQTAAAAFDHSNCQYPDRWSNPIDGCDNSDPAVPECIKDFSTKAGEDACIDAYVAKHELPKKKPIKTITTPGTVKPNQCGGK